MAAAPEMVMVMDDAVVEVERDSGNDEDKLSYEIFSILETKFLFGHQAQSHPALINSNASPLLVPFSSFADDPTRRGRVCVLSIDATGTGVFPATALSYLESSLRAITGDQDAAIADYFDLVAGAGSGGLIASMLFSSSVRRPLLTAEAACHFLAERTPRLLQKPKRSNIFRKKARSLAQGTAALELIVKDALGEKLTLRDTIKPVLVPCYDLRTGAPFVFSRADAVETESFDFRLWEVCLAAWAEPGRFNPADTRSVDGVTAVVGVDGGVGAVGNPAVVAVTHVLHNKQEFPFVRGVEDLLVLSLGGACSHNVGRLGDLELRRMQRWGSKQWVRPVAKISSDGAADLVDHAVALAFGKNRTSNYVRIQANGSTMNAVGVDMEGDPSMGNTTAMMAAAEEMLKHRNVESVLFEGKRIGEHTNAEKLEWFASELVHEHRSRRSRIAPTVSFKHPAPRPWASQQV